MRYRLHLTALELLDGTYVSATVYGDPEFPGQPTEQLWARTATTRTTGSETAREWTREALNTMLAAL